MNLERKLVRDILSYTGANLNGRYYTTFHYFNFVRAYHAPPFLDFDTPLCTVIYP